jgi:hypothetical protein
MGSADAPSSNAADNMSAHAFFDTIISDYPPIPAEQRTANLVAPVHGAPSLPPLARKILLRISTEK